MCGEIIIQHYSQFAPTFNTSSVNSQATKLQIDFQTTDEPAYKEAKWLSIKCASTSANQSLYLYYGYKVSTVFAAIGNANNTPLLQNGIYLEPIRYNGIFGDFVHRWNTWNST